MAKLPFNDDGSSQPAGPRVRDVQRRRRLGGGPTAPKATATSQARRTAAPTAGNSQTTTPANTNTTTRPSRGTDDQTLSVSQLAGQVKRVLNDGFAGKIRVVGEVSNFRGQSAAGHWFFSLKDDRAAIRCVCFASTARKLTMQIADGLEVVATGRVDFYDRQGSLQVYIDKLEPVGQGALELQLRQLLEQLRQAGYFDPAHKRPLPLVPRRVAVVTSRDAAALQDVINTASQRWAGAKLMLLDVRVQGQAAAPEVAAAIGSLSQYGGDLGIDGVILTRGGGSIEDLWAFNERQVADAIYDCPIPTVAAIGHETDTTVAELVADIRCATPTQAAMQVIPDREALADQLHQYDSRLKLQLDRRVKFASQRLDHAAGHTLFRRPTALIEQARDRLRLIARHRLFARPQRLADQARQRLTHSQARLKPLARHSLTDARSKLANLEKRLAGASPHAAQAARQRLDQLAHRLHTLGPRAIADQRRHLDQRAKHLEALGPQHVLNRGYCYTLGQDGHILRSAKNTQPGQRLTTVLHDGRVHSTVEDDKTTQSDHSKPRSQSSQSRPKSRVKQSQRTEETLFDKKKGTP